MMDIDHTICGGCLSVDRKLIVIKDELKILFHKIISNTDNVEIKLCWECTALLRRVQKFKEQVKRAQKSLAKFMTHRIICSPLSQLAVTNCNIINITEHTEGLDDWANVYIKTEEIDEQANELHKYRSDDDVKCDGLTDDGNCSDIDCDNNDTNKNFKSNTENDKQELSHIAQTSKVKKKTRNRTKESYNESDEEPLKLNNKINVKQRSKKVAREGEPRVRQRREEPAGVVNTARVARTLEQLNVSGDQLEMVLLTWDEVEKERQEALQTESFTRYDSRCHDCVLGFNHRSKLEEHRKKHQPVDGGEQCGVCRVWCKDARCLTSHRRRHRLRWRCRVCGGTWSRAANAADHTARAHGAPPPTHACALCGHVAATFAKLRNHLRSHGEPQKCDLCGKVFRDRSSLRTHLFIHKGEKNYSCPRCDKRFLFKSAMEIHLVTHDASAQLYCHQCDVNFKNRMSFNQHMRYNLRHIDPAKLKYACDSCDKKFAKATRLEEHKMAIHLKLTPIACSVPACQFSCSSRSALRTHVRMQHRDGRERRNHVCHLCGKAYTTKNSLQGHLRAHSGERPLRCPRCPAAFGYDAALYNHIKHVHLKHKKSRDREPEPADWSEQPAQGTRDR